MVMEIFFSHYDAYTFPQNSACAFLFVYLYVGGSGAFELSRPVAGATALLHGPALMSYVSAAPATHTAHQLATNQASAQVGRCCFQTILFRYHFRITPCAFCSTRVTDRTALYMRMIVNMSIKARPHLQTCTCIHIVCHTMVCRP